MKYPITLGIYFLISDKTTCLKGWNSIFDCIEKLNWSTQFYKYIFLQFRVKLIKRLLKCLDNLSTVVKIDVLTQSHFIFFHIRIVIDLISTIWVSSSKQPFQIETPTIYFDCQQFTQLSKYNSAISSMDQIILQLMIGNYTVKELCVSHVDLCIVKRMSRSAIFSYSLMQGTICES